LTIAAVSAGKEGDVTNMASQPPNSGKLIINEAVKVASCRIRWLVLPRPTQSGSRRTGMPSRISR
jgi:hypothetical protein